MDNSKSFWRTMNNILPSKKKSKQSISLIKFKNQVITEKPAIAESFNSYFSSIVQHITSCLSVPTPVNSPSSYSPTIFFTDARFSVLNLLVLVLFVVNCSNLKQTKGLAWTLSPRVFLRMVLMHEICSCITEIINMSIK
jgi:hypothetical protein